MHTYLMCQPVCVCYGYGESTYTAGHSLLHCCECNLSMYIVLQYVYYVTVCTVCCTINITLIVQETKLIKFPMQSEVAV